MVLINESSTFAEPLQVRRQGAAWWLQIQRPQADNALDDELLRAFGAVLDEAEGHARVLVVEGLPEVFCVGADFKARADRPSDPAEAEILYDLLQRLRRGPWLSVAHVRGRANAGGVGLAAACDVVICDEQATFALSELLFGLVPACIMPFLIERVGPSRARVLTLSTRPLPAPMAQVWGLADECVADSATHLRRSLARWQLLPTDGLIRCKRYLAELDDFVAASRPAAVACNREAFGDPLNQSRIERYVRTGRFPWEANPQR